jgi:DHA2 family multidrug resistance protein
LQDVQQGLVDTGLSVAQAAQAAPGQVLQILQTQVAILSYEDIFFLTAGLSLAFIPTALLMSGIKATARAGEG